MIIFEDYKKELELERIKLEASPFYIKIPKKFWKWLISRFYRLEDVPFEVKCKIQRIVRGYSDADVWNLNDFIVEKIRKPLKAYIRHQETNGMSLPPEFENNPTEWLLTLSKMEYAFDQVYLENNGGVERIPEEIMEHRKKIQEGFEKFGYFLQNLWD